MSIYMGPKQPIFGPLFWQPVCVTNKDKAAFWAAAVIGGGAQGALIGLLVGMGIAVVTGVPLVATGGGAPLAAILSATVTTDGFIIGAAVGVALGAGLAWHSACPECGSCFKVLSIFATFPFTLISPTLPAIPLVVLPSTGTCPIIPPGCP